ncbi:MAG TPA: porin [Gemmatimonadaceae bacterium]|nr:porin [Gemmatimonadaceae bacterium]
MTHSRLWWALSAVVLSGATLHAQRPKPDWQALHANEFRTPITTIYFGGGFLVEGAAYEQDAAGRAQVAIITGAAPKPTDAGGDDVRASYTAALQQSATPRASASSLPGTLLTAGKIRDTRFIIRGRLATRRNITWQSGFMYDWLKDKWFIRQTVFTFDVPEIHSNFWVGRMKEGPSLNRVMVGYDGWGMERFTFSDAAIPLLADGIRWNGYLPRAHLVWNLGYFVDLLSEGESFSYFDNQVAGRLGFVRMESNTSGRLLHVALGFHAGVPNEGTLQLKSKPEASGAPNFVDTGKIPATSAQMLGFETYYRQSSWLYGAEYYWEHARSPSTGNPTFSGGGASVLWIVTGETREYVTPGSFFRLVRPAKSVFQGGPGAIEVGLQLSNTDLDGGTVQGGKFWRFTPVLNWHLSDEARLEFEYGYGSLDRYGMRGHTQFFQSRIQLQL